MKNLFFVLAIMASALTLSCKKTSVEKPPMQPASPLVTAAGTPDGIANSKLIKAAPGGNITSTDGKISITIPANALAADETISIQPITNTAGFGPAKAYRLAPHGIVFSKPVTVSFKYMDEDINGTAPEFLSIAFQDNAGAWQSMNQTQVNKQSKQLTVTTTHFSDWGFFPLVYIEPGEARVGENETIDLKVMYASDPADMDVVPLPGNDAVWRPFQIPASYVKKWLYTGTGTLTPSGSNAVYKAPSKAPAQNPEAVSAEINFRKKGTFLLVSNITVLSGFHIDYLQVDETEVNLPQLKRGTQLFIYGNFGNDPGANKRSVAMRNIALSVTTWSSKLIVCDITAEGPGSSGEVVVRSDGKTSSKLLNEWTVEFNYAKKESPNGSLTRKTTFIMRLRGDAIGYGSGGTAPLLSYTDLNKSSKALINMPGGSYSNAVTVDACGTYKVQWAAISNHVIDRSLYATGDGFNGRVFQTATGFGVKIKFTSDQVLKSTRTFEPCTGNVTQQVVNEPVYFEGYHEETIWFPFATAAARTSIKAGSLPVQTGTGVAPGLFFDAVDVNPDVYTIKTSWAEALPKYN